MSFLPWQPIFLAALCQTGSVAHAAQQAGVTRQNAYLARSTQSRWGQDRLETLAFAQVWRESLLHAAETVEVELRKRALEGVEREKHFYYKGQCVGVQKYRVYNDSLLMLLAKLILPSYKDREMFEFPATLRPPTPTLLDNHFSRLDEDDLDELEDLTNLASDLWCQVLNILDGSPASEAESEEFDSEAETQSETDDSEVSSSPIPEPQVSSEPPLSTPPSRAGKGDGGLGLHPEMSSQSDLVDDTSSAPETELSGSLIPDSQVSSEPPLSTPHLPLEAQPSGGSTLGKGDGGVRSTPHSPQPAPTDAPPPGAAPEGALVYDFANAYRRVHGLT